MMKHITLIGAALLLVMLAVMPASAVWHNNVWLTDEEYQRVVGDAIVVHDVATGVDSKYRDTNPALEVINGADAKSCRLEGNVRCGYNTLTTEVFISNVLAPNTSVSIPVLPDSTFSYEGLAPGNYTLMLKDGNGGQPEYSTVTCIAGAGIVRPQQELLGHAVSATPDNVCQMEILSASYGAFEERCTDSTEYRYWIESHEHECVPGYPWDKCENQHGSKKVTIDTSHWSEWQKTEPDHCYYATSRGEHREGKLCESKVVEDCEMVDRYSDVTQNVKSAVASGHTGFVFDNSKIPGGIFDLAGTTLLSQIEDPAQGIVKHISIDYKNCDGIEKHISGEEYQQINL